MSADVIKLNALTLFSPLLLFLWYTWNYSFLVWGKEYFVSRLVEAALYEMNNHNKIILLEQIAVSSLHVAKAYSEKVTSLHWNTSFTLVLVILSLWMFVEGNGFHSLQCPWLSSWPYHWLCDFKWMLEVKKKRNKKIKSSHQLPYLRWEDKLIGCKLLYSLGIFLLFMCNNVCEFCY